MSLGIGIVSFNALPSDAAEERLFACLANRSWAARVVAGRPYTGIDDVMRSAEAAWSGLPDADWLRAFAAHPRIGERGGHAPESSDVEQKRVTGGAAETLATLAHENRAYEARFGHVFLISASGRTAEEILAALRERMGNDPATELRIAAHEQRKITRLRLEKLLNE